MLKEEKKRDGYVKGVDISFWNNDIGLASVLDKNFVESLNVDMWVPRYPSNSPIPIENEVGNIGSVNYDNPSIRQYSDKGVLDGYFQKVDLNVSYVNYPELMRKYGLNHLDEKNKTESRLY